MNRSVSIVASCIEACQMIEDSVEPLGSTQQFDRAAAPCLTKSQRGYLCHVPAFQEPAPWVQGLNKDGAQRGEVESVVGAKKQLHAR